MFDFKSMLLSQIEKVKTEPEIIELANQLQGMPIFREISQEEIQEAIDLAIHTLNISYGESYSIEEQKHQPWFQFYYKDLNGATRWDRYEDYLKNQKNFAPSVIQKMKENLFSITDLLGNPNGDNFQRKGLIVGDVQSGKTANYVGLMNLATDAKYKLIIVLTGTTNTLREQTQIRIEEGLGIRNLSRGVSTIPNADYSKFINPVYLTSREQDFTIDSQRNFQVSLESTNTPIVIVTKKNVTALKNIIGWLNEYSKNKVDNMINSSLLLIDDEADFASVNTRKEDDNPTAINSRIRDILNLFTKSSYIGFTATPYANIFINPATEDEMFGQDLFPKDYIYVLGESSEYVGVQSIFSDDEEEAVNRNMLITLSEEEVETYLPLKHKKEHDFQRLAPSMIDAINLFLISNVIRDLRGDVSSHRSMLINASRFIKLHEKIKTVVTEYVDEIKKNVRLYGKLSMNEALKKPIITSLKSSYEKYYNDIEDGYSFDKILSNMNDSIFNVKVAIVNGKNKEVDYLLNEREGERVIVIGGFALSRGLTLEGLTISYYWRNSVMYDSLLQMGRWFGYRNGYKDLCKIFMSPDVIDDYKFIALATKELKEDLEINSRRGLTPKEFGIKVRSGQVGLIITARNKMRTGESVTTRVDFSKDIIETTAFSITNNEINEKNRNLISKFIGKHKEKIKSNLYANTSKKANGIKGIDKTEIIEFLSEFVSVNGSRFDSNLIIKWLRANENPTLNTWDLAFVEGKSNKTKFDYGFGIKGVSSDRTIFIPKSSEGIVKNKNSRLGSPTDGKYGIDEEKVEKVVSLFNSNKTIPQKEYFIKDIQRNPLILIYSVFPKLDGETEYSDLVNELVQPIPLLSIGIPEFNNGKSRYVEYTVNKVYQDLEEIEVEEE